MAKKTKKNNVNINTKRTISDASYSSDSQKIVWCFDMIDRTGKFAFDLDREDFKHKEFLNKLISYSNLTWSEIKRQTHDDGKSKHHFLQVDTLSKDAVSRISARNLEEYSDAIFSFALQNKLRVIGIRINEKFHVLWYDSNHEICPSKKTHT